MESATDYTVYLWSGHLIGQADLQTVNSYKSICARTSKFRRNLFNAQQKCNEYHWFAYLDNYNWGPNNWRCTVLYTSCSLSWFEDNSVFVKVLTSSPRCIRKSWTVTLRWTQWGFRILQLWMTILWKELRVSLSLPPSFPSSPLKWTSLTMMVRVAQCSYFSGCGQCCYGYLTKNFKVQ